LYVWLPVTTYLWSIPIVRCNRWLLYGSIRIQRMFGWLFSFFYSFSMHPHFHHSRWKILL
jgi:hypothetical protein